MVRNIRNKINREICSKVLWELLKRIMGETLSIMCSSLDQTLPLGAKGLTRETSEQSDYFFALDSEAKTRYLAKISLIDAFSHNCHFSPLAGIR